MFYKKIITLLLVFSIALPLYSMEQKKSFSWSDAIKVGSGFVAGALLMYFVKPTKKIGAECTLSTCKQKMQQLEEQKNKAEKENEMYRGALPHTYFANEIGTGIYHALQNLGLNEEYEIERSIYKLVYSQSDTGNLWQVKIKSK